MTVTAIVDQHLLLLEPRYTNFTLNCPPNRDGLMDAAIVLSGAFFVLQWSYHPTDFNAEEFQHTLFYYALFLALDLIASLIAFLLEPKRATDLSLTSAAEYPATTRTLPRRPHRGDLAIGHRIARGHMRRIRPQATSAPGPGTQPTWWPSGGTRVGSPNCCRR